MVVFYKLLQYYSAFVSFLAAGFFVVVFFVAAFFGFSTTLSLFSIFFSSFSVILFALSSSFSSDSFFTTPARPFPSNLSEASSFDEESIALLTTG